MKAKLPLFLSATLLSVTALSGCFGKKDDEKANDVITIAIVSDSSETTTMNTFINGYKSIVGNEDKKFKVVKMTNYGDYIQNAFMYDELADIVQVFDSTAEYYTNNDLDGAGNSLLLPLSSYMQRDGVKEEDFFESIIEMTKCKIGSNDVYWVPRDYNKVVCGYNKRMFEIAGVDYPRDNWTWEDFENICNQLQAKKAEIKEYSGSATFFPVDMNLDFQAVYYPVLKSYGGELIDKATKTCFGNTEEAVNIAKSAWGKLLAMADSKLANAPGGAQIPFTNKQAAMMFMVRPNLPTYVKGIGEDAIDFVSLPTFSDIPSNSKSYIGMGCSGYGMTTACPEAKREAVWDFLKYIVSKDGQNAFSAAGSGIPCLKELAEDPNAIFKQYLVHDGYYPNHDAFIAHPERDLPANYLKGFEVSKQLKIDKYVKDRTLGQFYKKTDRDSYFLEYKNKMEEIWK